MTAHPASHQEHASRGHYARLFLMIVLSFIAMYVLMYAMVDRARNVYSNLNQVYMAALMTAAMVIIELTLMWRMYHDKKRNGMILGAAAVLLIVSWLLMRRQTGISDRQFLRSMIPHHAGAILMCEEAPIRDAAIRALCENIVTSQQTEIDLMKRLLGGAEVPTVGDSAAVAGVAQQYHAALADGDSAAALSLLGDGAVILESGDLETRDEYRTHHLPADIRFARAVPGTRGPVRVFVRSNVAWAASTSSARGAFHGRANDVQGAELMVLTRERDGWKIRAIHWSSHPVTAGR